jgi:hypothetical protein
MTNTKLNANNAALFDGILQSALLLPKRLLSQPTECCVIIVTGEIIAPTGTRAELTSFSGYIRSRPSKNSTIDAGTNMPTARN